MLDEQSSAEDRLSRISTMWTVVIRANREAGDTRAEAFERFIDRYHGAVYRYLLGATKSQEVADELFQEFALRFARGGFRSADPSKGRFRDFLRTVLINLINDHHRAKRRQLNPLDSQSPEPAVDPESAAELDASFVANWREELLSHAWKALADLEAADGHPWHTVLEFRAQNPELRSGQIAAELTARLRPRQPFTDSAIRKLLQRARERFADFLLDEVAESIEAKDVARLEEELIELDLLAYCRTSLDRRREEVR